MIDKLKQYYYLVKPGIIRGNVMVAAGAFFFGSGKTVDLGGLGAMIVGLGGIIAAGCVFNNILDRHIDAKMERTKNRALVTGAIRVRHAAIYGISLLAVGIFALLLGTNQLALLWALAGLFLYVVVYGAGKRTTVHGTLIGGLSGAVPPVVGYSAATGVMDANAWLLFVILMVWQMPHFYAIAIFRKKEYAAAELPIITVKESTEKAKQQIMAYIVLFVLTTPLLAFIGTASATYAVLMGVVSMYWLINGFRNYRTYEAAKWGRGMFGLSLIALTSFALLIAVDAWLP